MSTVKDTDLLLVNRAGEALAARIYPVTGTSGMYYSEQLQSPVSEAFARSQYGIHPAAPEAMALGIYPLKEVAEGYTAGSYRKEGDHYEAIPMPISNAELAAVQKLKAAGGVEAVAKRLIPEWDAAAGYVVGNLVEHQGRTWKATSDNTGNEPDDVPGDWAEVTL